MKSIKQINKELEQYTEEYLYEMSLGAYDKQRHRNLWIENPNTYTNNNYFKYGDSESYTKETKCCRISLDEPKYIYHKNRKGVMDWNLTKSDKKELIEMLNSQSTINKDLTVWENILYTYNLDRFQMDKEEFIQNNWTDEQYPDAYRINYTMPDYIPLKFDKKQAKNRIA